MLDCASKCQLKHDTDGNCNAFKYSDNNGNCQLAKVSLRRNKISDNRLVEGDLPGGPGCGRDGRELHDIRGGGGEPRHDLPGWGGLLWAGE